MVVSPQKAKWVGLALGLLDRIVSGQLPPGVAIPSETQLGEDFDVSRTVVREGIKALEAKGVVRIDRGKGTVVQDRRDWKSFDPDILSARLRHGDPVEVLREVLVLRVGLEPEIAAAAARAGAEAQRRLRECFLELEAAQGVTDSYVRLDGEFHALIADMSGFRLSSEVLATIAEPVALQRKITAAIPEGLEHSHTQHKAIFDAISAHDSDAAWQAMREHIMWAEKRLEMSLSSGVQLTPNG